MGFELEKREDSRHGLEGGFQVVDRQGPSRQHVRLFD